MNHKERKMDAAVLSKKLLPRETYQRLYNEWEVADAK